MCFSCHIHNCLLRHSFSKLRTSGISTTCVLGKCSKRSPQQSWELPKLIRLKAQSIVTTLKKKQKTTHQTLDVLISPFIYNFKLRYSTNSIPPSRVPAQKLFSTTFTNQSHSKLPLSQLLAAWLQSVPIPADELILAALCGCRSIFSANDNYCPHPTIVTLGCVSHTYSAFLKYCIKSNLYRASAEKTKLWASVLKGKNSENVSWEKSRCISCRNIIRIRLFTKDT